MKMKPRNAKIIKHKVKDQKVPSTIICIIYKLENKPKYKEKKNQG
jgi:hypothetical protein